MPRCSFIDCPGKKSKNKQQLTLHRFPQNEQLRNKWLAAIGKEKINPRHTDWFLCSLHFNDNCFNRTLEKTRLRENSVPKMVRQANSELYSILTQPTILSKMGNTKTNVPSRHTDLRPLDEPHLIDKTVSDKATPVLYSILAQPTTLSEIVNTETNVSSRHTDSSPLDEPHLTDKTVSDKVSITAEVSVSQDCSSTSAVLTPSQLTSLVMKTVTQNVKQQDKMKSLEERCVRQRKLIKRLNGQLQRKTKKIANLKNIIRELILIRPRFKKIVRK